MHVLTSISSSGPPRGGRASRLGRSHTPIKDKMKLGSGPQCHASVRLPFLPGVGVAAPEQGLSHPLSGTLCGASGKCRRPPQLDSLGLTQKPTLKLSAGYRPGSLGPVSAAVGPWEASLFLPAPGLSHPEVGHRASPCGFFSQGLPGFPGHPGKAWHREPLRTSYTDSF